MLLKEEIEALHGRDAADLPGASLRQQLGSWRAQFIVAEVSSASWMCADADLDMRLWAPL